MKTLTLLFILLSVTVYGQGDMYSLPRGVDSLSKQMDTKSELRSTAIDSLLNFATIKGKTLTFTGADMPYYGPFLITDKLLFDYEQECYNDSTIFHGIVCKKLLTGELYVTDSPSPDYVITNYVRDTTLYIHKQPEFADFIKWLRKN